MLKKARFLLFITAFSILYSRPLLYARDYAADIISIQGNVSVMSVDTKTWIKAADFQKLFPGDAVRTGQQSRAAILFVDQTQIKLNENTILEIKNYESGNETKISWGRTAKSLFNLVSGEIWIRSGIEALDLEVDTPVASAAIRGTEFVVRTDEKETTVTVVDGSVNLKNSYGEVLVSSGEMGRAELNKPPYKTVIINPEDAVQWSLYYPGNICYKDYENVPPAEMTIIEEFFRLYHEKKLLDAVQIAKDSLERKFPNSSRILTLCGFGELMVGNAKSAKENLDKALEIDPEYSLAHSILSNIYLVQNNKEKAMEEAALSVKTNPNSPSAYVSLSWAKQGYFDIPGAIESARRAVELDNKNIQGYVTLCRLLFGSDRVKEAEEIINKAVQIAPDESTVNATKGFLLSSRGETKESIDYFDMSVKQDSTQALGHLGLGLAYMRLERIPEALKEFLISTLLEPKVSLYQSYMGKAYYQVAKEFAKFGVRKEEAANYEKYIKFAEKTFKYASYLDPKDPTPYLYNGVLLNDINKPVDAITHLNESIKLNNNRAVYRSRLLLDRDRATENISLAIVYNRLGLSNWGSYLAMRSLQSDFSVSGAHRFLGSSYLALRRGRTQAGGSELLQSRLFSPVNENSFNTFNTYTSLFETPDYNNTLTASFGEDGVKEGAVSINGGTSKYALAQVVSYYEEDGYLPVNDDYSLWNTITMLKYATAPRAHIYGSFVFYDSNEGDQPQTWDPFYNDPDYRLKSTIYEGALGYFSQLNPDTYIAVYAKAKDTEFKERDEVETLLDSEVLPSEEKASDKINFWDGQIELIKRIGNHQFIFGFEHYNGTERYNEELKIISDEYKFPEIKLPQRFTTLVARDYWRFNNFIEFDLGLRYNYDKDGKIYYNKNINTNKLTPQGGILLKPFSNTTLRFAAINSIQRPLEENIFPANTSGFVIDRNDESSSETTEYAAALDQIINDKTFFTISGSYRKRETPSFTITDDSLLEDITYKDNFKGANVALNRILNRYTAVSLEYYFLRSDDQIGLRNDNQAKLTLRFVHPSGWFAGLTEKYNYQKNEKIVFMDAFDSSFWTTDAQIGYEFPKKQGKITLSVENLFDKEFRFILDPLVIDTRLPVRRAIFKVDIYF